MVPGIPPKTTEEGARIPIRLALQDIGNSTGKYWANEKMSQTGTGHGQFTIAYFFSFTNISTYLLSTG